MLSRLPPGSASANLLVGNSTSDDAAVLRIEGNLAIAQTVDFFTPIVDDPRVFGAIAAANSVSDIYAMGADPVLALAIAAFPTDVLPLEVLSEILAGGEDKAREAGFPIAGGHTIIDDIPKYGLCVTGIVAADRILRNSTANEGDVLFLTKPLGNGILVSAHRTVTARGVSRLWKGTDGPSIDEAIHWMCMLNRDAATLMRSSSATAATDVTGYGLLGHLREMCGLRLGARVSIESVPLLAGARDWYRKGVFPAGSQRNADTLRPLVINSGSGEDYDLLCDAQTSGGLLFTVSPAEAPAVTRAAAESGLFCARIGEMTGRAGFIELVR